jgi:pectin methylesterase-like acyl-CoA thioesterase
MINANTVAADTITVDNSGEGDYTFIQQIVNNSSDKSAILVNKGVYVENVDVDKKLAIISTSGNPEIQWFKL